ncbi:hypothetical protein, partial [Bacillus pumilus]|uniref:hypothetical protein n=1 Tax=Bacillus pumilus TaxID=1408 RepID=UPI003B67BEDB
RFRVMMNPAAAPQRFRRLWRGNTGRATETVASRCTAAPSIGAPTALPEQSGKSGMPNNAFLELTTHRLHYRIDADTTNSSRPWLLFCNSL